MAVLGFLAALVEQAVPLDTVLVVTGSLWALTVLGTAVALANVVIPHRVARGVNAASVAGSGTQPAPIGRWWAALLVTVPLVTAGAIWRATVVGYDIGGQQMRDTRVFAYLLWAVGAAAVLYTAALGRKVVRRITDAQANRRDDEAVSGTGT